jgi:hypothetical protein
MHPGVSTIYTKYPYAHALSTGHLIYRNLIIGLTWCHLHRHAATACFFWLRDRGVRIIGPSPFPSPSTRFLCALCKPENGCCSTRRRLHFSGVHNYKEESSAALIVDHILGLYRSRLVGSERTCPEPSINHRFLLDIQDRKGDI